jgi:hypothetical protein
VEVIKKMKIKKLKLMGDASRGWPELTASDNKIIITEHDHPNVTAIQTTITIEPKDILNLRKWELGQDEHKDRERRHEEKETELSKSPENIRDDGTDVSAKSFKKYEKRESEPLNICECGCLEIWHNEVLTTKKEQCTQCKCPDYKYLGSCADLIAYRDMKIKSKED